MSDQELMMLNITLKRTLRELAKTIATASTK